MASPYQKVVLVLVDGLKFATAIERMPFLESCVRRGTARRWTMECGLPSLSRPLYETIRTGLDPADHGILTNEDSTPSKVPHVFGIARAHGRTTAASAYGWLSELYNGMLYDPVAHATLDDEALAIQYGRYYLTNDFNDATVFSDARRLTEARRPNYLLVHPMGCDDAGHKHGGRSPQYARAAARIDGLLDATVPAWLSEGYRLLVTSDHGMDDTGDHGGDSDDERLIPFYAFGATRPADREPVSQRSIAPTVLNLLNLPVPEAATVPPLDVD